MTQEPEIFGRLSWLCASGRSEYLSVQNIFWFWYFHSKNQLKKTIQWFRSIFRGSLTSICHVEIRKSSNFDHSANQPFSPNRLGNNSKSISIHESFVPKTPWKMHKFIALFRIPSKLLTANNCYFIKNDKPNWTSTAITRLIVIAYERHIRKAYDFPINIAKQL